MNYESPIQELDSINGNRIFIKRDDLLPFAFGGNKVRIAQEFFADMELKNKNCMVGYGNARSNLCRALSVMARAKGYPCYIISPNDDDGKRAETFNSRIVSMCGAVTVPCDKRHVSEAVTSVLDGCIQAGLNPYYIYGDPRGNGNEAVPVKAYIKTTKEIINQEQRLGIRFDRIYLASGTGMTQSGLIIGSQLFNRAWDICGISVARPRERGTAVIQVYIDKYYKETDLPRTVPNRPILFLDDYVLDGYGTYNDVISQTIYAAYQQFGIAFDPTYTGKAFWGMDNHLRQNNISGKNVLFIHTGGTPLFFDFIASQRGSPLHTEPTCMHL